MLSLFLLINTLSLTNYQQYTEVPYVNDPIYNLTFDNFTNITSCSNYCDDFYNCSGFVLRDNTTCLGVHNDTVTTFENNSVYFKKRYCNSNCNSLNFFINTEGDRCFCDEQCDDIEFDDCCNDYHSFCVTSSPTTSPTSTPTSSPTSTPTSSPTTTSPTSSPTTTSPTSSPTSSPSSSPTSTPTTISNVNPTVPSNNSNDYLVLWILLGIFLGLTIPTLLYCLFCNKSSTITPIQMTEVNAYKNGTFTTSSDEDSDRDSRLATNDFYHTDEYNRSYLNQTYQEADEV